MNVGRVGPEPTKEASASSFPAKIKEDAKVHLFVAFLAATGTHLVDRWQLTEDREEPLVRQLTDDGILFETAERERARGGSSQHVLDRVTEENNRLVRPRTPEQLKVIVLGTLELYKDG